MTTSKKGKYYFCQYGAYRAIFFSESAGDDLRRRFAEFIRVERGHIGLTEDEIILNVQVTHAPFIDTIGYFSNLMGLETRVNSILLTLREQTAAATRQAENDLRDIREKIQVMQRALRQAADADEDIYDDDEIPY